MSSLSRCCPSVKPPVPVWCSDGLPGSSCGDSQILLSAYDPVRRSWSVNLAHRGTNNNNSSSNNNSQLPRQQYFYPITAPPPPLVNGFTFPPPPDRSLKPLDWSPSPPPPPPRLPGAGSEGEVLAMLLRVVSSPLVTHTQDRVVPSSSIYNSACRRLEPLCKVNKTARMAEKIEFFPRTTCW